MQKIIQHEIVIIPKEEDDTNANTIFINKYKTQYEDLESEVTQKVKSIRNIRNIQNIGDEAFYIHNQEEYNLVINYLNVTNGTIYSYCNFSKHQILHSKWNHNGFIKEDWYIFKWKDNNGLYDEYWVELLSEQKENWNEYIKLFEK